ncbi:hypothetical protein LSCM4_07408 [Leishmania orientalis]|uniref:DNA-directed DNA polymerase X domain-containing protein n=1 Tax=Leishmania orientalis TaxID=2249476 RepID=A0A836HY41_9TRYP|nr:hypothetical protein LSCM4_07408 [Leishmania orientalis]
MRVCLSSIVPRTGRFHRRCRADTLFVVGATPVSASPSCTGRQRHIRVPPRWPLGFVRSGGRLSEVSTFLPAPSAVAASLAAQMRGVSSTTSTSADAADATAAAVAALSTGTKLRHRRGAHRKRGRVSGTAAAMPPPDVPLGVADSNSFAAVVDSAMPATVLVDPSTSSSGLAREGAVKCSGAATTTARMQALSETAAEAEPLAATAAAHLNGVGASTKKPRKRSPSAGEANAAEPVHAASAVADVAAEIVSPRRNRKRGKLKRSVDGSRAEAEAAVGVAVTTVEATAVATGPAGASSPAAAAPSAEAMTRPAEDSRKQSSRIPQKRRSRRCGAAEVNVAFVTSAEADEVETAAPSVAASAAVVPSVTADPKGASALPADAAEGESDTPAVGSVDAAAAPSFSHVDATGRAATSDADAVEGRRGSSRRRRVGRKTLKEVAEEPANAKISEVSQCTNQDGSAADQDGGQDDRSKVSGALCNARRRRSSSRTRSRKRLGANAPTLATSAVVKDAIAASADKVAASDATLASFSLTSATTPQPATKTTSIGLATADTKAPSASTTEVQSSEIKADADVETATATLEPAAASCAGTSKRRARGNRAKKRVLAVCAAAPAAVVAASPPPPVEASADDTTTAATPASAVAVSTESANSFRKLFSTVDLADGEVAKGLSSLAAKKRLAAQIIRRRWQLQRGLKLSPQALPTSTTAPTGYETGFTEAPAARKDEAEAASVALPALPTPSSPPSLRRRPKRGRKSASLGATAPSLMAAGSLQAEPRRGDEAAPAVADKSKRRISKKGGVRVGLSAKADDATTVAVPAPASGTEVVEPAKAHEVEDAARDTEREADVAAAMAAAMELVSKPEVINDEFSLAPEADDDDAAANTTSMSHSLSALGGCCAPHQHQLQGAGDSKAPSGAKCGSSGGSGNHAGGSSSSGKGANSKDTLFFPDYRERVVQIFEQLTQINSALGERFKSQSYGRTVERFKRGDKVFQLLPPNLLPLPEDDPKKKAMIEALYKDDPAAQKKRVEEVERNRAKRSLVLSPDNLIPGLGTKLREKVIEILITGGLVELERQEAKPIIRAIRELTQVHGVGPRTAIDYFKKYDISTVAQLRSYAIKAGELDMSNKVSGKPANLVVCADKSKFHLNDAQRLGLVYYEDMCHRIPHEEGRLHEAFMKLRLRKYLGKDYELVVCGSYRRQVESAGDIDVLITHKRRAMEGGDRSLLPPSEVLGAFLAGLKADKYIEATLAQGPTKFMGLCRLRATVGEFAAGASGKGKAAKASGAAPTAFRARRLDVRYVDSDSFPAAMLYFTGSKNFNVIMRSEAIKKNCILNEYGLFRKPTRRQMQQYSAVQKNPDVGFHDMITRLARFDFSTIQGEGEEGGLAGASSVAADGAVTASGSSADGDANGAAAAKVTAAAKKVKKKGKEKTKQELAELREMAKIVERQRVKAYTEREIFEALSMDYVPPKDRSV